MALNNLLGNRLGISRDGRGQGGLEGRGIGNAIDLRLEGLLPSGAGRDKSTKSSRRYRYQSSAGHRGPGIPHRKGGGIERNGSSLESHCQ